MNKFKVIAISGTGRTGSTLLSQLLSQDPAVFNLGQLRHLARAYADDAPCSCGKSLQSCEIYGQIAPGNNLGEILGEIARKTGVTTFIDASKSPDFAMTLDGLADVDLYVLNLVRDPRAVACSWYRKKRSVSALIKNARDWLRRQQQLESWKPELGERFMAVRYEDLATSPEETVRAIARWASIPVPDSLFAAADRVKLDWSNQHLYPPANEGVLTKRETDVRISAAESWKDPGNRWIHRIARFFAGDYGRKLYP